jgi:hypothetical protein
VAQQIMEEIQEGQVEYTAAQDMKPIIAHDLKISFEF